MAKQKTMLEVVRTLQAEGYSVDYYVRKDGGILVRRINGELYPTGASGNARARQLVGATLSEARESQLKFATRARKVKRPTLDDEVYSEWKRVKKIWNKAFKAKGGKKHPAGYFGWARIKYSITHYGREEALRRISEAEKYATGFAYSKNVEYLYKLIKNAGILRNSEELIKLAEDLKENAYAIREEWIYPAYNRLYDLNKPAGGEANSPKAVAEDVRKILRL